MSETFVRTSHAPSRKPPTTQVGPIRWLRENLFSSWFNSILTILALLLLLISVPPILDWALFSAVFSAKDGAACRVDGAGACWAFVEAKFGQFLFGRYPAEERWRVLLTLLLGAGGLVPLLVPSNLPKKWFVAYLLVPFPFLAFVFLSGGLFGLERVETSDWGGLMVTLVVALTGIAASLPLGVLLALGRQSDMPVVRVLCVLFIEFWRGGAAHHGAFHVQRHAAAVPARGYELRQIVEGFDWCCPLFVRLYGRSRERWARGCAGRAIRGS